jgi:demethylmenaquinone methyltransferase/2-methoxy-6-polyprenyl-1,4-benzoquinol methylase
VSDDPLPVLVSNERIRATYDRLSGIYERALGPIEGPSQRRAVATLAETVDLSGARVLEVGCGPGARLSGLAGRVGPTGTVVGLDAAAGMVATARGRGGEVVRGDARRLPLATASVDAVLALDVLELFSGADLSRVLTEVRRVLRPDGWLCAVAMTTEDVPDSGFLRAYEWAYRHLPGVASVGCRPVDLVPALSDAGFVVEHREREVRAGVWPVRTVVARLAA